MEASEAGTGLVQQRVHATDAQEGAGEFAVFAVFIREVGVVVSSISATARS